MHFYLLKMAMDSAVRIEFWQGYLHNRPTCY